MGTVFIFLNGFLETRKEKTAAASCIQFADYIFTQVRPSCRFVLVIVHRAFVSSLVPSVHQVQVSGDATFCVLNDIIHNERTRSSSTKAHDERFLIGKPLPGFYLSVVGVDMLPVPVGQAGELLVGGIGVALGYHCRPQETSGKFLRAVAHSSPERKGEGTVHVPGLEPGHRVVCTGDHVVQRVAGGPLFWLGKLDGEVRMLFRDSCFSSRHAKNDAVLLVLSGLNYRGFASSHIKCCFALRVTPFRLAPLWQVKVRGVRVSLVEVEFLACRATGLPPGAFAVVYDQGTEASRAPDKGRLLAFFVPNGSRESDHELAKHRLQLAAVMTPSQLPAVLIPVVGGFPLTTSGKVS